MVFAGRAGAADADFHWRELTGYSFFDPRTRGVILGLIDEARRRGVPYSIDPGSAAFLDTLEPGEFLDWTRGAVVCFPNRDEAAALTGAADPAVMAASLAGNYGAVVVKLGADGAFCAAAGARPVHVAAKSVAVRDTTGAGDAFGAGFLAAWLNGASWPAATEAAVATAARAVAALGGRPARPALPNALVQWVRAGSRMDSAGVRLAARLM